MKRINAIHFTLASAIGLATLSACAAMPVAKDEPIAQHKPHWEYSGDHGPKDWANLAEEFSTCATGKSQSPFNISEDITATLPALGVNYQPVPMKIINNGHTIQADQSGGGQLIVDGKAYNLLQFHFHTPSEYSIDGNTYPLEAHLVHASESGELAVIGIMFKQGAANGELAKIWANMPTSKGENIGKGQMIDANKLLPVNRTYYRFMGSLTTPPCSEGVNWHMMRQTMTASAAQIAAFKEIYPMNARPLQDENNRLVVLGQ